MTSKSSNTGGIIHKIVSEQLADGTIIETVLTPATQTTFLAIYKDGNTCVDSSYIKASGEKVEPIKASNNLIKHGVVNFAERPEAYESIEQLINDIQTYIYRYVDISDHFRKIASYYILLTWVYDAFNELPYLRLRGDFGSGKTRALFVIGSLCNKAFFASGASTVSPIFHTLDTFRGTLIFDEADFRFSDEKSELVKIFNNGNVRGFPLLRTAMTAKREFDPQAFNVYGPKVVAMRKAFDDSALESRFLTEEMGQHRMRHDIPINLPDIQKDEARLLRNQLLMYRFKTLHGIKIDVSLVDSSLSPRLNQILVPLLSIIHDESLRNDIREAVRSFDQKLYAERSSSVEAGVLEILQSIYNTGLDRAISISDITTAFTERFANEYDRPVTARVVGGILRKRLRLLTYKSHGVYVLPITEKAKVAELCIRYGVMDRKDENDPVLGRLGDMGTCSTGIE
uniref:DUF3631 domain-containing protein n=1 Tax=Candidatus Nitrotoga fabula TaxID=2182327 RepID=A0A2X0QTW8_9PROT|nr:conserved protein of unknown function [Candidatus Nitrotoga fabula]